MSENQDQESQSLEEERAKREASNKATDIGLVKPDSLTSRETGELLVDMFGQMSFKGADLDDAKELRDICEDIKSGARAIVKTQV